MSSPSRPSSPSRRPFARTLLAGLVLAPAAALPLAGCVVPASGTVYAPAQPDPNAAPPVAADAPPADPDADVDGDWDPATDPDSPDGDSGDGDYPDDDVAAAGDPPLIAGGSAPSTAPPFDSASWRLVGNGKAKARVINGALELLPDNVYDASSVAVWTGDILPPYTLELSFATWDDDGGPVHNSGDGLAVMLLDDTAPYRRTRPPSGGARGVIRDGSGYAVHLPLYGERVVRIEDGNGHRLAEQPSALNYTGGRFARLRIDVDTDGIAVSIDGQTPLVWHGAVDARFGGVAIAAATGSADAGHAIQDVRVTRHVDEPRGPRRRRNLIVNGGFEAPVIGNGSWSMRRDIPGWRTVSGPGIEIQRSAAGAPAHGAQLVELDSDAPSAMVQDVATRAGGRYRLRYRVAARPGTGPSDNRLEVRWNGALVDVVDLAPDGDQTRWLDRAVVVEASTGSSQLELRDVSPGNGVGILIDEVSLVERRRR